MPQANGEQRDPPAPRAGPRHGLDYPRSRMAEFEQLVDELERSYRETQERMSDPSVYNDRRDTSAFTPNEVLGRSFIVKYTRLFDY